MPNFIYYMLAAAIMLVFVICISLISTLLMLGFDLCQAISIGVFAGAFSGAAINLLLFLLSGAGHD